MQKIFFGLLFYCAMFKAQNSILLTRMDNNATLTVNSISNQTVNANSTVLLNIDIKNTGASTYSYSLKKYVQLLNSNMTSTAIAYFSYAGINYPTTASASANPLVLNAGQSASQINGNMYLTVQLDEANAVGYSSVKYTIKNNSILSDSVQFTMHYNEATGLTDGLAEMQSIKIYKIGKSEFLVEATPAKSQELKITMADITGKILFQKQYALPNGSNKIIVSDESLPSGILILNLEAGNKIYSKLLLND